MSFEWLPWRRRRDGRGTVSDIGPARSCPRTRLPVDLERTSALGRLAAPDPVDEEVTGSYERPAVKPALCPVEDVAIVTAVMANAHANAFESIAPGADGVFVAAGGTKEERLRALSGLRTRSAPTRRSMISPELVPSWARGRMPAAVEPLGPSGAALGLGVRQAVDVSLCERNPSPGPGFGEWCAPAIVIEIGESPPEALPRTETGP